MAVLLGITCRLRAYLARTSFWNDEAFIVLNVTDHRASELMGPLDYNQAAPPGFLWIERAAAIGLGTSEYSLRLFPLAAGLGAMGFFAALAWRAFPGPAAVFAGGWFAFNEKLITYGAEVKQYSSDALLAVVLIWLAIPAAKFAPLGSSNSDSPTPTSPTPAGRFVLLALTAAIGVWVSHPAAIIFGAISLALAPAGLREGWRGRMAWVAGNAMVLASFVLLYRLSIVREQSPYLYSFWAAGFPPTQHPARVPIWLAGGLYDLCKLAYPSMVIATALLTALGLIELCRRQSFLLLSACVGPVALLILAAFARKYPFSPSRLSLFLLPELLLLCAAGAALLIDRSRATLGIARWILPALLLGCGIVQAGGRVIEPHFRSHLRPTVQYVRAHRQPGDALFILGPPFYRHMEFYCYWRHPLGPVFSSLPAADDLPVGRFWLVFAFTPGHPTRYIQQAVDEARSVAVQQGEPFYVSEGSAAYLFDRPAGLPSSRRAISISPE